MPPTTPRRALVSLPESAWKVIDDKLKGELGDGDAEVVRNIVMLYLVQNGFILKEKAGNIALPHVEIHEEILGQIDIHDAQIEALVELLEEKGHVDTDEWSRRIKKKMQKTK